MGEAKRRAATHEERAALAIERDRAAREAKIAAEQARWDALTPEQQEAELRAIRKRRDRVSQMRLMTAMVAGGAMPFGAAHPTRRFPR